MTFEVRPLSNMGAEIIGLDLGEVPDDDVKARLNGLWGEHGVLLFRSQSIGPEEQIAFSRIFGELEKHPLKAIRAERYPELMELSSRDELRSPVAYYDGEPFTGRIGWHKDLIYTPAPNRGALLKVVTLPERHGQTGFADQAKAYDALPDAMRARIEGLEVVYRFGIHMPDMPFFDTTGYVLSVDAPRTPADAGFPDFPDVIYPLVLTHPVNGRKMLNVSQLFLDHIVGMRRSESDSLLQELITHAMLDAFTYEHEWATGDLIMWDNWRCMHRAMGTHPGMTRLIHRTTIKGDAVLGRALVADAA